MSWLTACLAAVCGLGVSVLMEEGRRLREEYEAAQEELQAIKRAGGETTPPPPQDDSDGDGKAA